MIVKHSLEPIYDEQSQVLILGSIPSVKSRELGFYYAHPQNRFWKVIQKVFDVELSTVEDKVNFLHQYHIALYDVIEQCEIVGSSDASIKNVVPTDLVNLINKSKITKVYTTGKKAYDLYQKYQYPNTNIQAELLPSTSPANAKCSLEDLIKVYENIKKNCL